MGLKQHRYQIGSKWCWKKYNQMERSKRHCRKVPSRSDPSVSSERDMILVSDESELPFPDITSLRAALSELFTSRSLDEESLGTLREGDRSVLSHCLRLCLRWCGEEIQTDKAQLPFPYGEAAEEEPDNLDNKYALDVRVFIYLLDRYIGTYASSSEHDSWITMANEIVRFCPIKMLFTMSTLIVVFVSHAKDREDFAFEPPYVFNVAKLGIEGINRHGWRDEKLVDEFCDEFEAMLKDYTNYSQTFGSAVSRYAAQKWSEPQADEDNEIRPGYVEDALPAGWPGSIRDDGPYSVDEISPWLMDGLVGGT
ncbi:hypothetical protein F5Y03DRAFT_169230 [Xylaria venustula]|nr:hypothetical protein F5Y03DRAFT_169230 [Xylaria venustula]